MLKRLFYRGPMKIKEKKKRSKAFFLLLPLFLMIAAIAFVIRLDAMLFPVALQAAEITARGRMNEIINYSTMSAIDHQGLSTEDFYSVFINDDGQLSTLSVNTILINNLTNELAVYMSRELMAMDNERVEIPYGALTGVRVLANIGPMYTVYLMPIGEVMVDYSSSFSSVGINQVNFQVWLNVKARMSIINPLQSSEIVLERKIPLVNTVINAEIPNVFFNAAPDGIIISPP